MSEYSNGYADGLLKGSEFRDALRTKVTELEAENTWGQERAKLLAKVQDDNERLEADNAKLREIAKNDGYTENGEHILCLDCFDSGWNEDREGRSPCTCISESEPYQLLEAEVVRCKEEMAEHKYARAIAEADKEAMQEELKQIGRWCTGEDQIELAFDDTEALHCIAKYIEQAIKEDTDDGM